MPEYKSEWEAWKEYREEEAPQADLGGKVLLAFMDMLESIQYAQEHPADDPEHAPSPIGNYLKAVKALEPIESAFGGTDKAHILPFNAQGEITGVKEMFALCFFARPEGKRASGNDLTPADKKKLTAQFKSFERFLLQRLGEGAKEPPIKATDFMAALREFEEMIRANTNSPMQYSRPVNSLASWKRKKKSLEGGGVEFTTPAGVRAVIQGLAEKGLTEKRGAIGINAHKVLCVAMCLFAAQNTPQRGTVDPDRLDCIVQLPLREFAIKCGRKVAPCPEANTTPEERERDESRLNDARAQIRQDLKTLRACDLTWEERTESGQIKKNGDFKNLSLIGSYSIENGNVTIAIDPKFAQYLITRPLTQFPEILLQVDSRNPNAYSLGLAIAAHANMDSNIKKGTADRLSVGKMLESTQLPGYGEVKIAGAGWDERIKTPFEEALDALVRVGLLADWYYCGTGGAKLADEQADFADFYTWSKTLVHFELTNPVDHTERLAAKRKRRPRKIAKQETKG